MLKEEFESYYGSKVNDEQWADIANAYHHPYFKTYNKEQYASAVKLFGYAAISGMAKIGEVALTAYNEITTENNAYMAKVNKIKTAFRDHYGVEL